jgi:serine/threonine protein kinase
MDLFDSSLSSEIARRREKGQCFQQHEIVHCCIDILQGLEYLHDTAKIAHRDLKVIQALV